MKKTVINHIIIMAIAIVAGGMLAKTLHEKQISTIPSKSAISGVPIGGFHKFASDVKWMLFINYMGSLQTINEDNKDEVVKRLEQIIDLNPNFEQAIHMGAMSLSNTSPDQAVEFLSRAIASEDPTLKKNWKLPFLAGFILMHYKQPAQYSEAARYFRMALERSEGKPEDYVINSYLRARGNANGIKDARLALLDSLVFEWKKTSGDLMETTIIPNVTERLLVAAQAARDSHPDDEKVTAIVTEVSATLGDKHICPSCLHSYGPGDNFCAHCGNKVKPYGQCSACKHVLKGNFCSNCGVKAKQKQP
eukprot:TRINITY_DN15268_c0_g1_i2.p4 TRINITY_DN15268_c0_g1~~TRINITY_DN15268_c0_g1_i2.p4  ORF type:complete len:306 (+),score=8.59 TRINITY_DN15268_c0_g1_i2:2716-3633(+)